MTRKRERVKYDNQDPQAALFIHRKKREKSRGKGGPRKQVTGTDRARPRRTATDGQATRGPQRDRPGSDPPNPKRNRKPRKQKDKNRRTQATRQTAQQPNGQTIRPTAPPQDKKTAPTQTGNANDPAARGRKRPPLQSRKRDRPPPSTNRYGI